MTAIPTLKMYARHKDGTYVAYQMSQDSMDTLDNFVKVNLGLEERVSKQTYHITVIYSRNPVPHAEAYAGPSVAVATANAYEVFPTKDGGRCLVLRVSCDKAESLNKELGTFGATSDYSEYKPHVTLAYNIQQEIDIATLPLPQFPIYFNEVTVAPLDPLFVPAND